MTFFFFYMRFWLFGLLALIPIPILLFSSHFPTWAPPAALAWLAVLFVAWGLTTKRWLSHTPADLILLVMILLLPLGLWASPDRQETLARSFALIADVALFYAIIAQSRSRYVRWLGWGLLLASIALTLATIPGTRFMSQKLPLIQRDIYQFLPSGLRLPGDKNGFNPNMTAGVLAPFLPVALVLALRPQNLGQRMLALFTLALLALALLLTQSRGALLGVALAIPVVTGLLIKPLRWVWWGAGLLTAAVMAVKGREALTLIFGANDIFGANSLLGRTEIWSRALTMGNDFAFSGVGLGMYQSVGKVLYPVFVHATPAADIPHPHNIFLWSLAEMGYPGLIAFLAFYMILAVVLIRRYRLAEEDWARMLAAGLLGAWVVYLVHGLVDVPLYSPLSAIVLWGLFGAMMAVGVHGDDLQRRAREAA